MPLQDALTALGVARVIWVDDLFAKNPTEITDAILNNLSAAMELEEIAPIVEGAEFDPVGTRERLSQALADLGEARREEIMTRFLSLEAEEPAFEADELAPHSVQAACDALGVSLEDRCSFDAASAKLNASIEAGDTQTVYIIDLNESAGSDLRGLELIRLLWDAGSQGLPFILTHAAEIANEGDKEDELRQRVLEDTGYSLGIPISVISKDRLPIEAVDEPSIQGVFEIALKRAGLRRAVHAVLGRAENQISTAFEEAAGSLLRVPPEQLDRYVIERGYVEGVSEMHVIERALGARISQSLRYFFGTDPAVIENTKMMRAFRGIALTAPNGDTVSQLADFRKAEVWDSEEVINHSYSPIACGDVFELDTAEEATRQAQRKFVLLGQPCDIALRSDGRRVESFAILVPITIAPNDVIGTPKAPLLPFKLDGRKWRYDFRQACAAKLAILDLASFRSDGRVCVDKDHRPPTGLLPGQLIIYSACVKSAERILGGAHQSAEPPFINEELTLLLSDAPVFKHIKVGAYKEQSKRTEGGRQFTVPARVTWHLRRVGRVRMPFASSLLNQFLQDMGRPAFDIDF